MAPLTSCSAKVCNGIQQLFGIQSLIIQMLQTYFTSVLPYRPTVWRRARRFYWLHWVPKLSRELSSQYRMHLDHQSSAQTQDPHCCSRNLPAYWGRVWRLLSNEKKLWVKCFSYIEFLLYQQTFIIGLKPVFVGFLHYLLKVLRTDHNKKLPHQSSQMSFWDYTTQLIDLPLMSSLYSTFQLCDDLRDLSDIRTPHRFHVPLQEALDTVQVQRGKQRERLPGPICHVWW